MESLFLPQSRYIFVNGERHEFSHTLQEVEFITDPKSYLQARNVGNLLPSIFQQADYRSVFQKRARHGLAITWTLDDSLGKLLLGLPNLIDLPTSATCMPINLHAIGRADLV